MNTPAHLIFGLAAYAKPGNWKINAAALTGAVAPDLSLYLMVSWAIYFQGVPPVTVFREYYYSPEWQQVFAVDNSFVLWGLAFGIAAWARNGMAVAFTGAALIHLCFDFPFHNHDARMHFWPLSDWVFVSPFSYWDSRHNAGVVEPLELSSAMLLSAWLLIRFRHFLSRVGVAFLATAELVATGFFRWFL